MYLFFFFYRADFVCQLYCTRSVFGLGQKYCIVIKYAAASAIIIIIIILVHTADSLSPTRVNDTPVFGVSAFVRILFLYIRHSDVDDYLDTYT